jgi:hypothetical protein
VVVLWYGLIATFIGSTVGAICNWRWYRADGGNEAFYAAMSSTIVAALSGIALGVQYFFDTSSNDESEAGPARNTASLPRSRHFQASGDSNMELTRMARG